MSSIFVRSETFQTALVYTSRFGDTTISSVPEALQCTESSNAYRRSDASNKELQRMLSRGLLNALPFELHILRYQFCGPGTRLEKRLARGAQGINLLDAACRERNIAYSQSNALAERHAANNILAEKARKRIIMSDSTLRERESCNHSSLGS